MTLSSKILGALAPMRAALSKPSLLKTSIRSAAASLLAVSLGWAPRPAPPSAPASGASPQVETPSAFDVDAVSPPSSPAFTGVQTTCARGDNLYFYCDPTPLRLGETAVPKETQDDLWSKLPHSYPANLEQVLRHEMGLQIVTGGTPGYDGEDRRVVVLRPGDSLDSAAFWTAWATLAPQLGPRPAASPVVLSSPMPFAREGERLLSDKAEKKWLRSIPWDKVPQSLEGTWAPDKILIVEGRKYYRDPNRNLIAIPEKMSPATFRDDIAADLDLLGQQTDVRDATLPPFLLAGEFPATASWIEEQRLSFANAMDALSITSDALALRILEGDQPMLDRRGDQWVIVLQRMPVPTSPAEAHEQRAVQERELKDFFRQFATEEGQRRAAMRHAPSSPTTPAVLPAVRDPFARA